MANGTIKQGRLQFREKLQISKFIEGIAKDGVVPISAKSLKAEILKAHGHAVSNSMLSALMGDLELRFKGGRSFKPLSQRPTAVLARRLQELYIELGKGKCEDLQVIIDYRKMKDSD